MSNQKIFTPEFAVKLKTIGIVNIPQLIQSVKKVVSYDLVDVVLEKDIDNMDGNEVELYFGRVECIRLFKIMEKETKLSNLEKN